MRVRVYAARAVALLWLSACGSDGKSPEKQDAGGADSDDGPGEGQACNALCTGSGFTSGQLMTFTDVNECVCSGAGALAQAACSSFCTDFGVSAEHALLGMDATANDKCVCDGTSAGDDGQADGAGDALDGDSEQPDAPDDDATDGVDDGTDGSDEGASDGELDAQGYPALPDALFAAESTGGIVVNVTQSSSAYLPDGLYVTPHSAGGSSGASVGFVKTGFDFATAPSLQAQINITRMKQGGSISCELASALLLRYGMPPTGNNQLLARECAVEFDYQADQNRYTGKLTATMGDGLLEPSDSATATVKGRFTFTESE